MKLRKLIAVLLSLAMIATSGVSAFAAGSGGQSSGNSGKKTTEGTILETEELDPSTLGIHKLGEVQEEEEGPGELAPEIDHSLEELVRVSIFLEAPSVLDAGYPASTAGTNRSAIAYRDTLKAQQKTLTAEIEKAIGHDLDVKWNITLLTNAISANVKVREIPLIERLAGV